MAKAPTGGFEVPPEMRNVAEQSVTQARQAVDTFMGAAQKAVTKWQEQAEAAQQGAKGAGAKVMTYAERNIASSFDFAERMVRAKDFEEIMRLQNEFVRSQMESLTEQAREMGQSAMSAAKAGQNKGS